MIERFGVATKGPGDRTMPFSRAVRAGDFVFTSGQIPIGSDAEVVSGGIVEHSEQTILNLISALNEAGARLGQTALARGCSTLIDLEDVLASHWQSSASNEALIAAATRTSVYDGAWVERTINSV